MKTKAEQVKELLKKHGMCGEFPWWDKNNEYFNLTLVQIVAIHQYLKKNENNRT